VGKICREIIAHHLHSPPMWAIFTIQDILGMSKTLTRPGNPAEEQINAPADPYRQWKFRRHLSLDDLLNDREFSGLFKEMVAGSGRSQRP
jgi:4-alpha-glucanotransferase